MSIEDQLRETLSARAELVPAALGDPYERVRVAVGADRRRRRTAAVAVIAAAAVVAIAVPALSRDSDRSTTPAKHTQVVPGPGDPRWQSVSTWPVRGSLATDAVLLKDVIDHTPGARVLFAEDLPTSRVVVTWELDPGIIGNFHLWTGAPGAAAADLVETATSATQREDAVALRDQLGDDGQLVVLAAPGTRTAEVSDTVSITRQGQVIREPYRSVPLTDGVYSAPVTALPAQLMRVRVNGPEDLPLLYGPFTGQRSDASICLNCTGDDFRVKAEQATSDAVALPLGLDPATVVTTTVYYGPVSDTVAGVFGPGSGAAGAKTSLFVTDTRLEGGQVLRSALMLSSDGSGQSTSELATGVPIDADSAADRPYTLTVDPAGATSDALVQVFAPRAARVQLVSDAPTIYPNSAKVAVVDGAATVPVARSTTAESPYTVVTYDSAGRQTGRWPLELPHAADPYAGTVR